MAVGIGGGELESSLRSENEDRAIEQRAGALWRRVVVLDVENRLDGDC